MTDKSTAVTVYTAPWCVYCHMAKEYLSGKKVAFKEIDVGADREAAAALVNKTGQMGVPVIEIGDDTILGFDRERIDAALRDHKLV
jgi:glutaredoxin-like YruB-family protein